MDKKTHLIFFFSPLSYSTHIFLFNLNVEETILVSTSGLDFSASSLLEYEYEDKPDPGSMWTSASWSTESGRQERHLGGEA